MPGLLTVKGAAEKLHVSTSTIRNWIEKGYISAVRFPSGVRRLPEEEVERLATHLFGMTPFIEGQEEPPPKNRGRKVAPDEGVAV